MVVRLLGLGAVGAPLAVRLAPVSSFGVLLSDDRIGKYEKEGCTVNGVRYDFPVIREKESADLIIIACKNTDLAAALDTVAPHVGESTLIMSLLNGIESEKVISARFRPSNVIYSFITNLSSVRNGSRIDCFSPRGGLVLFNEKDSVRTERIDRIDELFTCAGIWHDIPHDIMHDMWWKFAFNICVNSLSSVMNLTYSDMNSNQNFHRLVRMLYREIRTVSAAEGIILDDRDEERCFEVLRNMEGPGKTSMLQDIEAHRPTENRYFSLSLSDMGRRHSIATPLCDFLYQLVEAKSNAGTC